MQIKHMGTIISSVYLFPLAEELVFGSVVLLFFSKAWEESFRPMENQGPMFEICV